MVAKLVLNEMGNYEYVDDVTTPKKPIIPSVDEFEAYEGTQQKSELVSAPSIGEQTQKVMRETPGQFKTTFDEKTGQFTTKETAPSAGRMVDYTPGEITPESQNQQQFSEIPDLVLIDGGKGHLSTAVQVFLELGINNVPLASIAKQNEEIFIPNFSEPVEFSSNPESLNILQKIRDEAHRFAINYHRKLRSKTALFSSIDTIPGIGPKKRKSILNKFGSIKNINKSSIEEITKIPGISEKLAKQLLSISKNMQ